MTENARRFGRGLGTGLLVLPATALVALLPFRPVPGLPTPVLLSVVAFGYRADGGHRALGVLTGIAVSLLAGYGALSLYFAGRL